MIAGISLAVNVNRLDFDGILIGFEELHQQFGGSHRIFVVRKNHGGRTDQIFIKTLDTGIVQCAADEGVFGHPHAEAFLVQCAAQDGHFFHREPGEIGQIDTAGSLEGFGHLVYGIMFQRWHGTFLT